MIKAEITIDKMILIMPEILDKIDHFKGILLFKYSDSNPTRPGN